jgi:5-methylthioadenosine/S-adenosylhomocysteine deaminase
LATVLNVQNSNRLIKNIDWIITVDAERRMITDGAIAIAGDRIKAVGKSHVLERDFKADEVIDGRGLIAIPGLIDTNIPVLQQLGRGAADACDMAPFMLQRTLLYEAAMTADDAAIAAEVCQLEMIRSGTTTFVDSGSSFPAAIAGVAARAGLRAMLPRAVYDVYDTFLGAFPDAWPRETADEAVRHAAAAIDEIRALKDERIMPAVALPWLAAASDALAQEIAALAKAKDVAVIAAAARSRDDAVASRRQHARTEVERLRRAGLLGATTLVAHAGWTSPDDLVAIKASGASVACCPSSSQRLGTGALELGRYPELLAFGVNVTLGSGSAMASNYVDIARQLYLFAGGSKSYRLDATVIAPEAAVEMATIRGAAALGLAGEIGSLEAGKRADITLFNMVAADWAPVINPIANLVFSARGGAHTVIAGGKTLLAAGEVRTLDEQRILRDGQARAEEFAARSGLSRFCAPQWAVV